MSEMQKRVAVVICERLFGPFDERELDSPSSVSAQSMAAASAVIMVMREPTEAVRAQLEHLCDTQSHDQSIDDGWRLLIDAATKDPA